MIFLAAQGIKEKLFTMEKTVSGICHSPSDVLVDEPELGSQAVLDWYMFGEAEGNNCYRSTYKKSDVKEKAKKHLLAMGWKFWYGQKGSRRELRYTSPNGKCFYSLRMACKGYIDQQGGVSQSTIVGSKKTDQCVSSNSLATTDGLASTSCQLVFDSLSKTETFTSGSVCETVVASNSLSTIETLASSSSCQRVVSDPLSITDTVACDSACEKDASDSCKPVQSINEGGEVQGEFATGNHKRKRVASFCKPMSVGDEVKGDLAASNHKRNGGKVLADLERKRDHSRVAKLSRVTKTNRIVRNAVIPNSSNRNPRTVLSWFIDNNVVLPRARVYYRGKNGGPPLKQGYITRDGIECDCCSKLFQLTAFEAHAGSTNHRPAANILLEDGRSLMDCQNHAKNSNENKCLTTNLQANDDICSVCHYGGDLILCDQCPSSFHKDCLGLQDVPSGDWFCPSCCCGICSHGKFQEENGNPMDNCSMICKQCMHKFHIGCLRSKGVVNLESYDKDHWFCGRKCEDIFLGLSKLLGKPIPVGVDNLTWTLFKSNSESDSPDIEASTETYSKLSVALSVMRECFDPVKDPLTNRDLVEDLIFSRRSELKRMNFRGFYTVLLERNEELITVATVRIHGEKVAEVPLVGTRYQYRRCGMCQTLMNELEKQLMVLGVEKLILPAAQGVLKTWTSSFRFSEMTDFERSQLLDYTFLDFQDTIMCQKFLMKNPGAEIVDQGLVDSAASHGKSNSECLVEEANLQKESSSNSRDFSKFYKRRKISACESQSSGYSIDTGEERFESLRPKFHSMMHSVDILCCARNLILF